MIVKPLNQIDITNLSNNDVKTIKNSLDYDLIVVLKNQSTIPWYYTRLVEHIGGICNYPQFVWNTSGDRVQYDTQSLFTKNWKDLKENYPVQRVTGMKKNKNFTGIFATGILDWHSNLNSPYSGGDGVALQAWDENCIGTSTSFLNTNLAYNDLDDDFKKELENVVCEYEYNPEGWGNGLPNEQLEFMRKGHKHSNKYKMWLVQQNTKGVTGLYFYTTQKCKILTEDNTLYQRLYDHCFQEKYIYQHWWEPGDIVLMDQLLTLHKRDQNDPEILAKRVLHRITFTLSSNDGWIAKRNSF